jgi:succinyl-CoA synthetase alpha subunit
MSILIGRNTRVVVQGITGRQGSYHTQQMLDYGTHIVAGVTPGKGGEWTLGVPIFDTVKEAVQIQAANTAIIFVPAPAAPDAIMEAAAAGVELIVCLTEHIPTQDMVRVLKFMEHGDATLIGPNSPGLITPGQAKVGIMPGYIHKPGQVGIVSRSGTLTYEIVQGLSEAGIGQSTVVGIGGDPIIGANFVEILRLFEIDPLTEHIVLIGEIGGHDEQEAAAYIGTHMSKRVTAFLVGHSAPVGKRMGHAGAIVQLPEETISDKIAAFERAGVKVARRPEQIGDLVRESLG